MLKSGTTTCDYLPDLLGLLEAIVGMLPAVYCVVDGLDEFGNRGDDLVEFLTAFPRSSSTVFKVFTTCRPNQPQIEGQLDATWSSFLIEEAHVRGGIDDFVSHRIGNSEKLSRNAIKVKVLVVQGSGRMFLWARLMLEDLENAKTPQEIDHILAGIPYGIGAMYDLIFQHVFSLESLSRDRCRKILHWIVVARQPLLVDELLPSHEAYNLDLERDSQLETIRKLCGSLITILGDQTVRLVHAYLRKYLLEGMDKSNMNRSQFSVHPD